jgi:hypothetical protein
MSSHWQDYISENQAGEAGPAFVVAVTGSESDAAFWKHRFTRHSSLLFKEGGTTEITSAVESTPRGNFLGTLQAWNDAKPQVDRGKNGLGTGIMMMLVGSGSRLSPFTQQLLNRKSAFPTPKLGAEQQHLTIGEVAAGSMNRVIEFLQRRNFRGLLVKWGDEFVLPGAPLTLGADDLSTTDFVRFGQRTDPTEELAAHKEWIVCRKNSFEEVEFIPRQNYDSLVNRLSLFDDHRTSVNLGSLAISFDALEALLLTFSDLLGPRQGVINWDPYFWIALHCEDERSWEAERAREESCGIHGIKNLEKSFPDFISRMLSFKRALNQRRSGHIETRVFDFGDVYWADFGLQTRLREHFYWLLRSDERGKATRSLYGIDGADENGNYILRSSIPSGASIKNSIVVDATIRDKETTIVGGVVIGGNYGVIEAPNGGIAIESDVAHLSFEGGKGMSFRSKGDAIKLTEAGRHSTIHLSGNDNHFEATEATFDDPNFFDEPVLSNNMSFRELASAVRKSI